MNDRMSLSLFFFNDTATTEIYTLSLHDALPIYGLNLTLEVRDGIRNHTGKGYPSTREGEIVRVADRIAYVNHDVDDALRAGDWKSTRLNSSHANISYAVFCLKKKLNTTYSPT